MTDVAIVGAPGYAGVELTRLVLGHPDLRLVAVTSHADAGKRIDDVYPAFTGLTDLAYEAPVVADVADRADVVFLAVPHTAALGLAPALLAAGAVVVDASADYRLKDPGVYERWYGVAHTSPELLDEAVYGLPELDRAGLAQARLIACPGCYPTATIIAAAPALEAGLVSGGLVRVDAKSGISGAGRVPTEGTHYPTVNESLQPYKVSTHRHTPEIAQGLTHAAGRAIEAVFVPHLVPMSRGLLSTVYLDLIEGVDVGMVFDAYAARYAAEPFVTVHPPGRMPSTGEVRGTNRAHIGVAVDPAGVLIVACAIDNLVKGTAGQAIQCMNLALGLPETAGLMLPVPVV